MEITDFGVFVNLGGIDGLVHRSELTYGRFNHPRDVVKVGDKVQVQVIDVDPRPSERINLSDEGTDPPIPGKGPPRSYHGRPEGTRARSRTSPTSGRSWRLETGLEGLVHVSEMSWTKRVRHPNEVMKEGDEVEAAHPADRPQGAPYFSLGHPSDHRRSLEQRCLTAYPPGTPVKGKITGMTDFGVFMEIEEGIEGLIHISELDLNRVNNPADLFKKGDEIEAMILNIDPVEQRASLSRVAASLGGGPAPTAGRNAGARGSRDYVSQGGGSTQREPLHRAAVPVTRSAAVAVAAAVAVDYGLQPTTPRTRSRAARSAPSWATCTPTCSRSSDWAAATPTRRPKLRPKTPRASKLQRRTSGQPPGCSFSF